MNARFYAPGAHATGEIVPLPAEEAEHLTRVLRLAAGSAVTIFNGRGGEFDAVVQSASKEAVRVLVGGGRVASAEARIAVTLAQSVLKGDAMDEVVRDAVMMGVAAIQPLVTTRSEVTRAALERGRRMERWTRIAISAAKQCGRATLPRLLEPRALDAALAALADRALPHPALMLVEPSASAGAVRLSALDMSPPREATIMIGPEGGWTPEEIAGASPACRLVTLGARTLRADAMPVIALAALFTAWGEF